MSYLRNGNVQQNSTRKVGRFKQFEPNNAPANFKNGRKNVNNQNFQQYNPEIINCEQFYSSQGQAVYQYIPPPEFGQQPNSNIFIPNMQIPTVYTGSSATAVAPNGEKIFIPLDDSRYELKRSNHDLYDMPQDCDLYPLSSEGNFESNVQLHSPRPVDLRGSLSDEWSSSSQDGPYSETESEHETGGETETDASEVANNFVSDVLKSITENVGILDMQLSVCPNESDTKNSEEYKPDEKKVPDIDLSTDLPEKGYKSKKSDFGGTGFSVEIGDDNGEDQTGTSSCTDTEYSLTPKREPVKLDSEGKRYEEGIEIEGHCNEQVMGTNKLRSKNSRAWKENRKDKKNKPKTKNKHEMKETLASKRRNEQNKIAEADNTEQAQNANTAAEYQENITIDGQGYFKSQQSLNSPYPYYIPDNYSFIPNQYQQYQFLSAPAPEYTLFIHDAYPPPAQDEVYGEVHKSLSGELINQHVSTCQSQTSNGGKGQQQSKGNIQTIFENASNAPEEQIHCNTEGAACLADQHENYGAANGSSPYTWTSFHTQSVYNQFNSCTVNDQQAECQGQIYVCYDEDSVYVDPKSGLSYPALHMTDDFLITVILREGIFLEITANKALRLVNHEKKLVVAINENGTKTCVIHPAARIYQSDTDVHAELYLGRRAKMTEELVMFGNKLKTYKFDHRMVTEMAEEPVFRDLSHDESVTFLSTNDVTGNEDMKVKMEELLSYAHFWKNGTCGSTVVINGTKVVQNEKGEVSVYCGPIKFLRMSPEKKILRLKTQLLEVDVETNWNVKVTRGAYALNASHMGFIISNGKIKACLDSNNKLQSFSMPDHRVLMLGQHVSKHPPGLPGGQKCRTSNRNTEPEGHHWGNVRRSPNDDQDTYRYWEEGWEYELDNQKWHKRWDPQAGRWVYPSRQRSWREYC